MSDDRTDAMAEPELEALGAALREQGRTRSGDLDDLVVRSHRRERRARLTVGSVVLALVVGLSALALTRAAKDAPLQTAGPSGGVTTSADATMPTTAPQVPIWTVNPSIVVQPDGDIWALEITYDPAVWTFKRFTEQPALVSAPGMATFNQEPRVQAVWTGPRAHEAALAAQAQLQQQPGILSTEVGIASPSRRTSPTTSPVITLPPGSVPGR